MNTKQRVFLLLLIGAAAASPAFGQTAAPELGGRACEFRKQQTTQDEKKYSIGEGSRTHGGGRWRACGVGAR
jgi:hypothetical protein